MSLGLALGMGFGGGGIAFTPISMPNLVAWYRSDVVTGSPVSQWTDQSGNGNHLVGTGATKPTYSATDAALNGLPSITTTTLLFLNKATTPALADPFTVFVVGYAPTATISTVFDDGAFPGVAKSLSFQAGNMRLTESGVATGAAYSNNTKAFIGATFNGASSTLWFNARTGSAANATSSTAATAGLTVGNGRAQGSGGNTFAEMVIVTGTPSAGDIDKLATYISNRYAITIGA